MIDRLPPELLTLVLNHCDAPALARIERTSKHLRAVTTQHGWAAASYGEDRVCHLPAPKSSAQWRAMAHERVTTAATFGHRPADLALDFYQSGRFDRAIIALQADADPDAETYLYLMSRSLEEQGRAAQAAPFQAFKEAVKNDDVAAVLRATSAGCLRLTKGVVATTMKPTSPKVRLMIAHELKSRGVAGQHNLMSYAVMHDDAPFASALFDLGFRATGIHLSEAATDANPRLFDTLLARQRFTVPDLTYAAQWVVSHTNPTDAIARLRALGAQGASLAPSALSAAPRVVDEAGPIAHAMRRPQTTADLLRCLVNLGADLHAVDSDGRNAWHWLAPGYVVDVEGVATFLQQRGVDITRKTQRYKATPLCTVFLNSSNSMGHVNAGTARESDAKVQNMARLLARFGAPLDGEQIRVTKPMTPLAFVTGDMAATITLLRLGAPAPSSFLADTVRRTVRNPQSAQLQTLFGTRAWTQTQRSQALDVALVMQAPPMHRAHVIRLLATHGARLDARTTQKVVARGPRKERLDMFTAHVSSGGVPPVMQAILATADRACVLPVLAALTEAGADLHATSASGANAWHALAVSAVNDAAEVAAFLAEHRVDVNAVSVNQFAEGIRPADVLLKRSADNQYAAAFFSHGAALSQR